MEGFYLGPLYIYTWGLTAATGVMVAVFMAVRKVLKVKRPVPGRVTSSELRVTKIAESQFWNLAIVLVLATFLGARISYILETWSYYSADPAAVFRLWEGGFSFFGGAIGAILVGAVWSKINKVDFFYLGWIFTPAWLFGLFFGRLGCFLIHDHLGKPTGLPWGINIAGTYRHEPAGYEAIWILLIGIMIYAIDQRELISKSQSPISKSQIGNICNWTLRFGNSIGIFPLSLFLYSFGRFFLDFTRAADDRYYGLTVAQWACIGVAIWASSVMARNRYRITE